MSRATEIPRVASLNEEEILEDGGFREELRAVAEQTGKDWDESLAYAKSCLEELAVHPEERYLDRVARLARFMYTRSYEPMLDVVPDDIARLRAMFRDHPMVFLWSHKSHLDSFVFMKAMYDNDFRPQPLSFAGINMAFTGFGKLAKRSGAIFLRRSFRDDPVYRLVFKHYIDYLVRLRLPLSWSIEGTRSRTGKLMPPKMGLIQWVVESYRRLDAEDAMLVPVSISFDQIAEIDDYVAMQRGVPKRKESLRWFIGYISGMKARNGRIYVRFGEPLSLSDAVDIPDTVFPADDKPEHVKVQKLAFEVMSRIEHATPITITDLVTMVLLAANDRAISENQIRVHAQEIIAMIRKRALPTAGDLSFASGAELGKTMAALSATSLVDCYDEGSEAVYRIKPGKQLAAAYYRNTIIHYFLASAIAEIAIATMSDGSSEDVLFERALSFRDLLKFEFFFRSKQAFCADVKAYIDERFPEWSALPDGESRAAETIFTQQSPLFGHSIMRSFIEAYRVMAQVLVERGGYTVDSGGDKKLIGDCLKLGQEMLLRKRIASESAISEPLFATAVKLARHRELLAGEAAELTARRQRFATEISSAIDAINILQRHYDQQQETT
ncbi:MAG: 1-acyl-sn-glycerol-3-phosphate acyltransferase [Woeseiaceae bacterium]|nr:1-acyl-sn-glycerol-3-phosphate acyltransferase [Woeseiaceae bacterium]